MSFSFKPMKVVAGESGGEYALMYYTAKLCSYTSWAFSSCGIDSLHGFYFGDFWKDKEKVAALRKWLLTNAPGCYKPQEFYFALSCSQLEGGRFDALIKQLGYVKKVDNFKNKAHDPNSIHLYRWSLLKDFPQ